MHKRLPALLLPVFLLGGCALSGPAPGMPPAPAAALEPGAAAAEAPDPAEPVEKAAASAGVAETAPVELAAADLWTRIREGYAIAPQGERPRIRAELDWYARHQAYLDRVTERARPYWHYIVEEVEARGMPLEIALLPIVESAFDPFAYSHGRAAGLWQFIPGTGRAYGLEQDWWYDGRRDVAASTRAALDYLQDLYGRFGDWLLALAAYNSGAGTVSRAIRHNQRRGLPTDFWHLDLPRETSAYVPKLLALKRLVADPEAHGIELAPLPNEPYLAAVDMDGQIDMALAAELAGIELRELYLLNPGFNRWATRPDGDYQLLLPRAARDRFLQALAELPAEKRLRWQRHRIRAGESLLTISRRYATTVDVLRQVNGIRGNLIRAGDYLMVPTASMNLDEYTLSEGQRLARLQNQPRAGRRLEHTVQSGESFWSIARRYGVNVRELAQWNGMAPGDMLRAGQTLVVWSDRPASPAASMMQVGLDLVRTIHYTVRRGDSLARIAARFGVKVSDLVDWNGLDPEDYLQPGQRLKLLVNVTNVSG